MLMLGWLLLQRVPQKMNQEFRSPIDPSAHGPLKRATPAPAWVALLGAWAGLVILIAAIVFVVLPGSKNPVAELERRERFSPADRFLPVPIYGITVSLFIGIVVLWQMRDQPRPLPPPLVAQRLQAWVGIALSLLAAAIIYIDVALRGPKHL